MYEFYCQPCNRPFNSEHSLSIHFGRTHNNDTREQIPKRARSPSPLPFFQEVNQLEPFHRYENDFVYQDPNPPPLIPEEFEQEDVPEVDFPGNPISLPFQSRKELNHVRWSQKSNISRTNFTEFLQLNKADPLYSSRSMVQVAEKIKRIPEYHPSLASGNWITESIMFECGPEGCPWNGEHTFIRKDPIEIIKSLIQCNVDTFSLDDRVDRDYLDDIRGGSLYRNAKAEMRRKLPNAKMVGIILAVDDTNLTNHSGSHIGRPLYMTTTNLPLETRRQINNFAWRPIGFLPHMKSSGTMTNVDKAWKVHAKAKFASVVIERVLAPLKDARRAGFEFQGKLLYPELICCLTDLAEAWKIWCLKSLACPVCTVKKDHMNLSRSYSKRNEFDIALRIARFEAQPTFQSQIRYSEELKTVKGHLPIKIGFTDFCLNPLDVYIPDLLHQPKKGVFANLLAALEQYLIHGKLLSRIENRMAVMPRFAQSLERFGISWFKLKKVTASNYTDMIRQMAVLLQDLPVAKLFADFSEFVFYAHYKSHTQATLASMEQKLSDFREQVQLHLFRFAKTDFTTPKYHMLQHYGAFVRKFGSLLNGDTEVPERLHVNLKAAYKRTNKKDDWTGQMARNLDEIFLVEQLYQQTQRDEQHKRPIHGKLMGRAVEPRLLSLQQITALEVCPEIIDVPNYIVKTDHLYTKELRPLLHDFVEFQCRWDVTKVKVGVYTGIACVHVNLNASAIPIRYIARAHSAWKHDAQFGKIYDHVMIQTTEVGRLNGSRLVRLRLIGKIVKPADGDVDEEERTFLAVRPYEEVEHLDNISMQSYTPSPEGETEILPATNLLRNVHVGPRWDTLIDGQENNPDIYSRYTQFVLNSHADQASYNYFY